MMLRPVVIQVSELVKFMSFRTEVTPMTDFGAFVFVTVVSRVCTLQRMLPRPTLTIAP